MCRSLTLAALADVRETDHLPDLVHAGVKGLKARFTRPVIHPTSDLFNCGQELGGLQPLSF
jgi:hypothetical protein